MVNFFATYKQVLIRAIYYIYLWTLKDQLKRRIEWLVFLLDIKDKG
jgi:hypothetical protein